MLEKLIGPNQNNITPPAPSFSLRDSEEKEVSSSRVVLKFAVVGILAASACDEGKTDRIKHPTEGVPTTTTGEEESSGVIVEVSEVDTSSEAGSTIGDSTDVVPEASSTGSSETTSLTEGSSTDSEGTGDMASTTTENPEEKPGPLGFDPDAPDGQPNGFVAGGNVSTPTLTHSISYTNDCDNPVVSKPCSNYVAFADVWTCNIAPVGMQNMPSRKCKVTVTPSNEGSAKGASSSHIFKVTQ